MRDSRILPSLALISASFLLAALLLTLASFRLAAQSVDVNLTVPEGIIAVQGKTSPNAQVKIYENSSSTPSASVMADGSGDFSAELVQMSAGVVNVGIRAIDTNGLMAPFVTKQVAVLSQQTTILDIMLPASVKAEPDSVLFGDNTINFKGRTAPLASVKISIAPSTVLTTTAGSQGDFVVPLLASSLGSAGLYEYSIETSLDTRTSDNIVAGTFVISPPVVPVLPPQERPIIPPFINDTIGRPEITYPTGSEFTSSSPFIIKGTAPPRSEVYIFDANVQIGVVTSDEKGEWQFYFAPSKTRHTLSANACINGRCSEASRTIVVVADEQVIKRCESAFTFTLRTYRLSAKVGEEANLIADFNKTQNGIVYIYWGDDKSERFEAAGNDEMNIKHIYEKPGLYSGYVIVQNGNTCQNVTYFAAEITKPAVSVQKVALVAAGAVGTVSLWLIFLKVLPFIRP